MRSALPSAGFTKPRRPSSRTQREQCGARDHCDRGQRQRQVEPVPQRQVDDLLAVVGQCLRVGLEHARRSDRRVGRRRHRPPRELPAGTRNAAVRLVQSGDSRTRCGLALAAERAPEEAQRVGNGEDRPDHQHDHHDRPLPGSSGRRCARSRRRRSPCRRIPSVIGSPAMLAAANVAIAASQGGLEAQTGELAQVAGTGGVVDDADDHEQRRLEQGMRDEHREPGHRHIGIADARPAPSGNRAGRRCRRRGPI